MPFVTFPKPRMIPVNGVELAVYEAGQGGIPLVLAHGWPELAYSWRYQIPALVEQGYHVIAPDQRGYGGSSKPDAVELYDIHHLTGDHVALLDALEIDKAIYVGHDWGAIIVWNHALLHPERVVGVANLSVPFHVRDPADPVAFWEKMLGPEFYIVHFNRQPGVAAAAFDRNPELFLRNMYRTKQWLSTGPDEGEPGGKSIIHLADTVVTAGEPMMSDADLQVFLAAFKAGGFMAPSNWYRNFTRNWETTADVEQRVRQPALMIYGEHDMVRKADMTPYVPDLEIHTLPCGHWIQQELPAETNRLLLDWLERRMRPLF
ncbi:MAG: pimeloyl-ACP methyl ester carboxylesterase [Cyclobacteriaceae bacterium]|jgi:pimeloyl-ACP methyl ester carboxylesterase